MNNETLPIRISKAELEELRARARAEGISRGNLVRRSLKAYCATSQEAEAKTCYEVIKRFLGRSRGRSKNISSNPNYLAAYGR